MRGKAKKSRQEMKDQKDGFTIEDVRNGIRRFEKKYGMSSAKFRELDRNNLPSNIDICDSRVWETYISMEL